MAMSKSHGGEYMNKKRLGAQGEEVSVVGLGCMAMSGIYGPVTDDESIRTIHAALEAGVTLIDTGDFYGMGHNELLIRDALKGGKRNGAFIQVKFGGQRDPSGAFLGFDCRPAAVKTSLAYTLTRLGTDHVDLYHPARLDPSVPIEETIGAIADLVKSGYVRHIGLSEVGSETIRRAHAVHPIAAVQLEFSLMSRGIEAQILPTLRELGIGVTAYGVLSRGLLGGNVQSLGEKDTRRRAYPRFQGENLKHNLALVQALQEVATGKGATVPQLAFAWVMSRGPDIFPLIGARNREQLKDLLGAVNLKLTKEDLETMERAVPAGEVLGGRYEPTQMSRLDSERTAQ